MSAQSDATDRALSLVTCASVNDAPAAAATLCRRNLLTYAYARKVWGARFDEQTFEVCSRCAKAAS